MGKFPDGSRVYLNSSKKPLMTVRSSNGNEVTCEWFDKDETTLRTHIFLDHSLELFVPMTQQQTDEMINVMFGASTRRR